MKQLIVLLTVFVCLLIEGCASVKVTDISEISLAEPVNTSNNVTNVEIVTEQITTVVETKETSDITETSSEDETEYQTTAPSVESTENYKDQQEINITEGKLDMKIFTSDSSNVLNFDAVVYMVDIDTINTYSYTYVPYDFDTIIQYVRPDIANNYITYDASIMSPKRYVAETYIDGEAANIEATDNNGLLSMTSPVVVSDQNFYKAPISDRHASGCLNSIDDCKQKAEDVLKRFYKGNWDSYEEKILPQEKVGDEYSVSGRYSFLYYCKYAIDGLECIDYTSGGKIRDYFGISYMDDIVCDFSFSTLQFTETDSGKCISVEEAVNYLSNSIDLYKDWPLGTISEIKLQYVTSYDERPGQMIPCWVFYDHEFGGICFAVNAIDGSIFAFCMP